MGSELVDTATGKLLWGMKPGLLSRMWTAPTKALTPLALAPEGPGFVRPRGLLRVCAVCPVFAGIEPYTKLVTALRNVVRHPRAVLEFAYDWRLPVKSNALLLAEAIDTHVRWWREFSDRPAGKVVVVAHSMGGLVARHAAAIPGALDDVSSVITLGTPFEGAAKAVVMLGTGEGAPVPASRLQAIAVTMAGVYDLLPGYRCIDEGTTVRRLTQEDVAGIGADVDLAAAASADRAQVASVVLPGHRPVIGVAQPTICSVGLDHGRPQPLFHTFTPGNDGDVARDLDTGVPIRSPGFGDGTVPRNAAVPLTDSAVFSLPQQHGPIAVSDETITFVIDVLRHADRDRGPRLAGPGEVGIVAPDVVDIGTEFLVKVSGVERPSSVRATLFDADTGRRVDTFTAARRDGEIVLPVKVYREGAYRVSVDGSGTSPVTQLFLAVDPTIAVDD
ncbi:esterase/lipase family protein [Nocardia gamkensis]|uniref:esterase/lipase family protein n=1 Tax=Nocardia gamkensis TaxID=352869 RepID=UPI0037CAD1B9